MSQFDNILDKKAKKGSVFDSIEIKSEEVEEKIVKKEIEHEKIDDAIRENEKKNGIKNQSDLKQNDNEIGEYEEVPPRRRPPPPRPGLLGRWRSKSKQKMVKQKRRMHPQDQRRKDRPPQKKSEDPDKQPEGFTIEEQQRIQAKFAHRHKLSKKERKKLRYKESQPNYQKFIITIFTISIFFMFLLFQYNPADPALQTIIILIGVILFMPIGMLIGWMILDPFMRCKIMRKMTKRNWGVINFVAKGKKIISRIKNLDNDLIWIKNKCWAVTKEGIFELDKNGDRIINEEKNEIDTDSIVTITETVPVMFIDMNSMQPLTFEYEGREGISPAELGSSLKGWVDNQLAKVMFLKKTMDTYFLIVIVCALVSAFYGYTNNNTLQDIEAELQILSQKVADLTALTP